MLAQRIHSRLPTATPTATPTAPSTGVPPTPTASETLRRVAQDYADRFRIGLDKAIRRFQVMDELSLLNRTLNAQEGDTFGGLWVEHEPQFRASVDDSPAQATGARRVGA